MTYLVDWIHSLNVIRSTIRQNYFGYHSLCAQVRLAKSLNGRELCFRFFCIMALTLPAMFDKSQKYLIVEMHRNACASDAITAATPTEAITHQPSLANDHF